MRRFSGQLAAIFPHHRRCLWELAAPGPPLWWGHHGEIATGRQNIFILDHLGESPPAPDTTAEAKPSSAWQGPGSPDLPWFVLGEITFIFLLACSAKQGLILPGTCSSGQLPTAWGCPEATARCGGKAMLQNVIINLQVNVLSDSGNP